MKTTLASRLLESVALTTGRHVRVVALESDRIRWRAFCPVCRGDSLTVEREDRGGRLALACSAGCEHRSIIARLDLGLDGFRVRALDVGGLRHVGAIVGEVMADLHSRAV